MKKMTIFIVGIVLLLSCLVVAEQNWDRPNYWDLISDDTISTEYNLYIIGNMSVLGNWINVTVVDYNVTGNITAKGICFGGTCLREVDRKNTNIAGPALGFYQTGPGGTELPHFILSSGGNSQATTLLRSMMIVNEIAGFHNTTNATECGLYMDRVGETLKIDCNTTGSGADLLVGDDLQIVGDLWGKDTDGEYHFITREFELLDELRRNTLLSRVNSTIDTDTDVLTILDFLSDSLVVNIDENNTILSGSTDTVSLTVGTNTSPIFNHVYYTNGATPTLAVSTTALDDVPDVAQIVYGDGYNFGDITGSAGSFDFIRGVYNRFYDDGAIYISGFNQTVSTTDFNTSDGFMKVMLTKTNITSELSAGLGVYHINSDGTYDIHTGFDDLDTYATGEAVGNQKYFNVVFGVVHTTDGAGRLFATVQNKPDVEYTKSIDAEIDTDDTVVVFPSDDTIKKLFIPVARVVMQRQAGVNTIQTLSNGNLFIDLRGTITATGGAPPTPGVTSHADLTNLNWASAGHTIDGTIDMVDNDISDLEDLWFNSSTYDDSQFRLNGTDKTIQIYRGGEAFVADSPVSSGGTIDSETFFTGTTSAQNAYDFSLTTVNTANSPQSHRAMAVASYAFDKYNYTHPLNGIHGLVFQGGHAGTGIIAGATGFSSLINTIVTGGEITNAYGFINDIEAGSLGSTSTIKNGYGIKYSHDVYATGTMQNYTGVLFENSATNTADNVHAFEFQSDYLSGNAVPVKNQNTTNYIILDDDGVADAVNSSAWNRSNGDVYLHNTGDDVMIGAGTPFESLHIRDTTQAEILVESDTSSAGDEAIIKFKISGDDSDNFYYAGIVAERTASGRQDLHLATDNSGFTIEAADARLTVYEDGNVEIFENLTVGTNITAGGQICDSNGCIGDAATHSDGLYNSTSWKYNGSEVSLQNVNANVVIGDTAGAEQFHVYTPDTDFIVDTDTVAETYIGTYGAYGLGLVTGRTTEAGSSRMFIEDGDGEALRIKSNNDINQTNGTFYYNRLSSNLPVTVFDARFEECYGQITSDWSPRANGGTHISGVHFNLTEVAVGRCSSNYDGVNDYTDFGDNLIFGDATNDYPFTVMGWVYVPNNAGTRTVFVSKALSSGDGVEWLWSINETDSQFNLYDGTSSVQERAAITFSDIGDSWHHWAVTYDGRGGEDAQNGITFYKDGVATGGETTSDLGSYVAMHNSNADVNTGVGLRTSASPSWFKGNVDEIKIYMGELSATDIATIYALES